MLAIKNKISLPYTLYTAIVFVAFGVIQFFIPQSPGLYTLPIQVAPLVAATFLTILLKLVLKNKVKPYLFIYSILSFLFLSFDYLNLSHAGLVSLAATIGPIGLYWVVLFARWNYRCLKQTQCRTALLLSSFALGTFAFAFPPLPLGPAALILLVPWFIVMNRYKVNDVLFATFWASMLYNCINYYWIYNVMNVGGTIILFGLFLLIAYFSVYNVLAAFVYTKIKEIKIKGRAYLLLLYPLFYAGLEMTRTRGDFAFPWSHVGYVFGNQLELLQMLPYIGIFGYTMIVIGSNMIVAKSMEFSGIKAKWPALAPLAIFTILLVQGSYTLAQPEAEPFKITEENSPSIAMVQPSIKQGEKWSKARFDSITTKTFGMVMDSVEKGTNLTILAETAIPDHIRRQPDAIKQLQQMAHIKDSYILTGALDYKKVSNDRNNPRRYEIYNASFLFTPNDYTFPRRYIKKHLVPFSERIPFDDVFPILNYVDFGEGDFVPGKKTPVYKPYQWTPYICYDAIFGDLVREAIRKGSRLMVVITNDGWFGRSTAAAQHMNLVRYRAIENGIPVARLANSGISGFIDQYGHYDQLTQLFTDRVIKRVMPLKTRTTLYQKIGDGFETFLLYFFAAYLLVALFGQKIKEALKGHL